MIKESPLLPDMPSGGPLEVYRKQASFSWKKLITLIDGEGGIEVKVCILQRKIMIEIILKNSRKRMMFM